MLQPDHGFYQQNGPERDQLIGIRIKNGGEPRSFEW